MTFTCIAYTGISPSLVALAFFIFLIGLTTSALFTPWFSMPSPIPVFDFSSFNRLSKYVIHHFLIFSSLPALNFLFFHFFDLRQILACLFTFLKRLNCIFYRTSITALLSGYSAIKVQGKRSMVHTNVIFGSSLQNINAPLKHYNKLLLL